MGHYGIGPLVATAILAVLGDTRRLSSSQQAVRCAALDITVHESDTRRRAGHLSRHGKQQRCSRAPVECRSSGTRGRLARVQVRVMQSTELDATLDVWRAASLARGRPGEGHRLAAARCMLEASTGTTYVTVSPCVIGMTLIEPGGHEERRATDDPSCVQISMVFVLPSAQRKGVGTALLLHVFDVARARRFTGVQVWTGTDNPQAQRFYSRLGMVPTGRRALGALSEQMQYELVFRDR
jgi:GNAT superfamily N-acetyltransferase